jgi:hypothetical protein
VRLASWLTLLGNAVGAVLAVLCVLSVAFWDHHGAELRGLIRYCLFGF